MLDTVRLAQHVFAGELSLSGELRPVRGALAMALALRSGAAPDSAALGMVLPMSSAQEAALVPQALVYGARHLLDVVQHFLASPPPVSDEPVASVDGAVMDGQGWAQLRSTAEAPAPSYADLADVRGQAVPRRALEIAAAGGHHVLLVGPPGSGKSMLAHRFAGLLPPMPLEAALESAAVASLAGRFTLAHWRQRQTRAPHHLASGIALVGGGSPPRPGEISLAHHGVLFMDEFAV